MNLRSRMVAGLFGLGLFVGCSSSTLTGPKTAADGLNTEPISVIHDQPALAGDVIVVPDQVATLEEAAEIVRDGQTILLRADVVAGNVVIENRSVTIIGESDENSRPVIESLRFERTVAQPDQSFRAKVENVQCGKFEAYLVDRVEVEKCALEEVGIAYAIQGVTFRECIIGGNISNVEDCTIDRCVVFGLTLHQTGTRAVNSTFVTLTVSVDHLWGLHCTIENLLSNGRYSGVDLRNSIVDRIELGGALNDESWTYCALPTNYSATGEGNLYGPVEFEFLRPMPDSPVIDAGKVTSDLPEVDLVGNPRVLGAAPDLGAYEVQ